MESSPFYNLASTLRADMYGTAELRLKCTPPDLKSDVTYFLGYLVINIIDNNK